MEILRVNTDIVLQAGYNEFEINSERDLEINITANEDSEAFVRIVNCGELRIRTFTPAHTKVSLLFWNDTTNALQVDESHEVMERGNLTVAYGECNQADTMRKTYVALRQRGARALVSSASLINSKKSYSMQVNNFAPETFGNMENYAVVLKNGRLMIDAIGKITKGSHGSESHQTSRALSFEQGQSSTILPELLIDEDDVQASHAMSMGRVDEDQLYYLMSRGLTLQQCTALLSTGYLLPITRVIDEEVIQEKLKEELEAKIAELC